MLKFKVSKDNYNSSVLIETTLSIKDEIASKIMHTEKVGDQYTKKQ